MYQGVGQNYTGATPTYEWQGGYGQVWTGATPSYEWQGGYGQPYEDADVSVVAHTNGNGDGMSMGTKVAIGVAAAAALGLLAWQFGLLGKKRSGAGGFTPNKARGKRARAKSGKIITLKSGARFGHETPPKRYWKMGAKRQGDYAWPDGYKYPLVFRGPTGKVNRKKTQAHIRSAQAYFARSKRRYPPKVRRTIARRINVAKRQYGVGGKVVKP